MLIPKKYHIHVVGLLAVAAMILYPALRTEVDPQTLAAGTRAAEDFLQLVDAGEYEQSWETASSLLTDKVFLEVWNRQLFAMRSRVGTLLRRQQEDAALSEMAEGAPDGQYLTLTYGSSFKNQDSAIETVILALEADGNWRVAGYFLK
jgi:hypothetical protein